MYHAANTHRERKKNLLQKEGITFPPTLEGWALGLRRAFLLKLRADQFEEGCKDQLTHNYSVTWPDWTWTCAASAGGLVTGEKAHKALILTFQAFVSGHERRKKQAILGYLGSSPSLLPGYRPSPDQGMCLVPQDGAHAWEPWCSLVNCQLRGWLLPTGAIVPAFCVCSSHENTAVGVQYSWGVSQALCLTLARNLVTRVAMWDCSAKLAYWNFSWIALCQSSHRICPLDSSVAYIIVLNLQSSVTLLGQDWMVTIRLWSSIGCAWWTRRSYQEQDEAWDLRSPTGTAYQESIS